MSQSVIVLAFAQIVAMTHATSGFGSAARRAALAESARAAMRAAVSVVLVAAVHLDPFDCYVTAGDRRAERR